MRAGQNVEMADETLKSRVVRAVNLPIHRRRPHAEGYQQIRGQTHVSLYRSLGPGTCAERADDDRPQLQQRGTPAGYTRQNTIIASAGGQYNTSRASRSKAQHQYRESRVKIRQPPDRKVARRHVRQRPTGTHADQLSQIDNLLADQKGGLAADAEVLRRRAGQVGLTPADTAARQSLLWPPRRGPDQVLDDYLQAAPGRPEHADQVDGDLVND